MTPYFLLAAVVTLLAALSFRVALSYSRPSFAMAGTGRALGITGALPADDISPEASGSPALAVRAARTWTILRSPRRRRARRLLRVPAIRWGRTIRPTRTVLDSMNGSDWGRAFEHTTQEYGYTVMMLLIKQFTEDPKALFWVAAVLTVVPVYLGIKRMSTDPGFSVALFVAFEYAASFNALRQCIAGALLFLGWTYLGKMNAVFWVLAVLALSFHLTAILAVVVLLIVRRWRPTLRATVLFLAGAVVAAAAVRVAPALMSFLDVLNPRYGDYLESGQTGIGSYLQIAAYAGMLLLAVNLELGAVAGFRSPRSNPRWPCTCSRRSH